MPALPYTTHYRGGQYVRNGLVMTGAGKILTAEERQKLQLETYQNFQKDMQRLHPERQNQKIIVQNIDSQPRDPQIQSIVTSALLRNNPPRLYPLKFTLQQGATLDATGKNTYPGAQIIQDVNSQLSALQTDHIDVAFFPWPTSDTLVDETLGAYADLQKAGKILALGGMDLSADELANILKVADAKGLPGYQVLAVNYNLYDRSAFEGPLQDLVVKENIAALPFTSLALGFLTGQYRTPTDIVNNQLPTDLSKYFTPRGFATLDALSLLAEKLTVEPAAVALTWLVSQPGVSTPLLLDEITDPALEKRIVADVAELALSAEDLAVLTKASAL